MAFARWDPIGDLLSLQQRLDRLTSAPAGWAPRVDVHETAEQYVLTAELPGIPREDFDIEFEGGRLTLSGVRRERSVECEQYHRIERGHGAFRRSFQLPLPVDGERITADLRDGILTVVCPKATDTATRRIRIS